MNIIDLGVFYDVNLMYEVIYLNRLQTISFKY